MGLDATTSSINSDASVLGSTKSNTLIMLSPNQTVKSRRRRGDSAFTPSPRGSVGSVLADARSCVSETSSLASYKSDNPRGAPRGRPKSPLEARRAASMGRRVLSPLKNVPPETMEERSLVTSLLERFREKLDLYFRVALHDGDGFFCTPPRFTERRFRGWIVETRLCEGDTSTEAPSEPWKPVMQVSGRSPLVLEEVTGREWRLLDAYHRIADEEAGNYPPEHKDIRSKLREAPPAPIPAGAADGEAIVGIQAFVRLLLHVAWERLGGKDRIEDLFTYFLQPHSEWVVRINNTWDGSGTDDEINVSEKMARHDVDRVLYIYDRAINNVFYAYKEKSTHHLEAGWVGSAETAKFLATVLEIEETRSFLQAVRLFPSKIAFSDIVSLACNCNGHTVHSQTLVVGKATDDVDQNNAHRVDPLTAVLTLPSFKEFLLRLSQRIFRDVPQFQSMGVRMEYMIRLWRWEYERLFRRPMELDMDRVKGVPTITKIDPPSVRSNCSQYIRIYGNDFCSKRGVYVRFGDYGTEKALAHNIRPKRIKVLTPRIDASESSLVKVGCEPAGHGFVVHTVIFLLVKIEVSNNGYNFSKTVPERMLAVECRRPSFIIDPTTKSAIHRIFLKYCKHGNGGGYNVTHIKLPGWQAFKEDFRLIEGPQQQQQDAEVMVGMESSRSGSRGSASDDDEDVINNTVNNLPPWFQQQSKVVTTDDPESRAVLVVDITRFITLITKSVYFMGHDPSRAFPAIAHYGKEWKERIPDVVPLPEPIADYTASSISESTLSLVVLAAACFPVSSRGRMIANAILQSTIALVAASAPSPQELQSAAAAGCAAIAAVCTSYVVRPGSANSVESSDIFPGVDLDSISSPSSRTRRPKHPIISYIEGRISKRTSLQTTES